MLNQRQAARMLGVTPAALAKWRQKGTGPRPFFKVSKTLILYPISALRAWLVARQRLAQTG